jgi:hypothetical protein
MSVQKPAGHAARRYLVTDYQRWRYGVPDALITFMGKRRAVRRFWILLAIALVVCAALNVSAGSGHVLASSHAPAPLAEKKFEDIVTNVHTQGHEDVSQVASDLTAPTPTPPINTLWIKNILIYHPVVGHLRRTTVVRLGERVRFIVHYVVTEYSMDCGFACIPSGTLTVTKDGRQVHRAALQSTNQHDQSDFHTLRLNTRFRRKALVGHLTAQVTLSFNGVLADHSVDFTLR